MCVGDLISLVVLFIFVCFGFLLYLLITSPYTFELLNEKSGFLTTHKFFSGQLPFLLKEPIQTKQLQLFKDLIRILNENQIDYWLVESTLLAFHLFKQLMPWEDKVTIAILHKDLHKLVSLRPILEKSTKTKLVANRIGYSYCENNLSQYPNIDIQILDEVDNNIKLCTPLNELGECQYEDVYQRQWFGKGLEYPKSTIFPLKKIPLEGTDLELNIPADVTKCLHVIYGKDLNIQSSKYACIGNKMTMNLLQRVAQKFI